MIVHNSFIYFLLCTINQNKYLTYWCTSIYIYYAHTIKFLSSRMTHSVWLLLFNLNRVPQSPYSQKLPHSDYGMSNRRPMSATVAVRPGSGRPSSGARKPKIDSKFIADPSLWDPATPRSESTNSTSQRRKGRPASAPVRRKTWVCIFHLIV